MNKRLISGAIIFSLLTGCAVGPKYRKPVVEAPSTFRGADPNAAVVSNSLADLKWVEVFKDEQLQELIKTALTNNYDLNQAIERIQAARANLGTARAGQFPEVTAGAGLTSSRNSTSGQVPLSSSSTRTFGSVVLNLLSFEVDVWGRVRRQKEAAKADLLNAEETRKAVMTTVVGDVSAAYFNLIELDTELEIARDTLKTRQESLNLTKTREQGGVATMLDVRQAEQLVYTAAQTIPDIERSIEQTENQIDLLEGKDPGPITRGLSLTEQQQPPDAPAGLPSSLLERRPDIRAAEATLIAATANIGVAKAAYFPQISLTGFMGGQSNQLTDLFSGPGGAWTFAPQVTAPIFNAGRVKSGVKFSEAQRQLALTQYQQIIKTAFSEVSSALVQYRKVKEIRVQQEQLVTTLQDRSRLAYLRYQGGVDTQLNALDADRDLFAAELSLAQTRRNELLALVQLYKALGGGWQ
ncbi:MAG: efflux transporter outer membrane subunit [Chloracidobacterium sp.]|nr:efflux transporter outer membrane subunit [Chloracidobacterium sp.]